MQLRKTAETPTTVTLEWDPVAGCDGYLFYVDGKRVSRTLDPTRRSVRFGKGGSSYRVEAFRFQAVDSDEWPDTPPPPVYKKVAPRVANKEGGSDARYCLLNQPGVVQQPDGTYRDDVARYDSEGLCLGGRNPDLQVPGLPGAKSMDGRAPCDIPPVGDPTKNTGSWAI